MKQITPPSLPGKFLSCQPALTKSRGLILFTWMELICISPWYILISVWAALLKNSVITTRKRSLRRLYFYMCLSFCPRGGGGGGGAIPACITGGIQHALQQVSVRGVFRPTAKGEVEGIWSRATAKGEVEGDLSGGKCLLWGVDWRTPPPVMATAAGGTHPTGMHSCLILISPQWQCSVDSCRCLLSETIGNIQLYSLKYDLQFYQSRSCKNVWFSQNVGWTFRMTAILIFPAIRLRTYN